MLDTFKARLKAKALAAGANLSQTRIDEISARLHKKFPELTDEAEHDSKLEDYYDNDELKGIAKQDDKVRTLEAKKPKEEPKPADDTKPKSEIDELKELVKGLTTTVQTLAQEKQQTTMQQRLAGHEKLKGIDQKLYAKWTLPTNDEGIDAFAEEVAATYGHLVVPAEGATPPGAGGTFVPGRPQGGTGGNKKVDPDLVNFVKAKVEQTKDAAAQGAKSNIITNN